jgi:flagellum-specific peptidoglycan hydrolase FlgJ
MTPQDFITAIKDDAILSAKVTKIPASFTIAQAALESGWGTSLLSTEAHNLFGVKADTSWHGETIVMRTREFIKGKWIYVPALWRKYPSWIGGINDHGAFLINNPRYKKAFATKNVSEFTQAVAAAGYATDPEYANKILTVIRAHKLEQYDA